MGNTSAERDIQRAKQLRAMKKGVKDVTALSEIEEAASRLERRAARKLKKVGRKGKARNIGSTVSL